MYVAADEVFACDGCGDLFTAKYTVTGLCARCKNKRKKKKLSPAQHHANMMKFYYGLTDRQYAEQLEKQGGVCAICGGEDKSGKRLAVDHDHSCCPGSKTCGRCLRGLLCSSCNNALGYFRDSQDTIKAALRYLEGGGVWQPPSCAESE